MDPKDAKSAQEGRATSFVAVEGAVEEDVPGGALLLGAYGAFLLLVMLYVVRLARLQSQLLARAEALRATLEA